jgi:glycosyltransferase involved in cell wall biosynthesis
MNLNHDHSSALPARFRCAGRNTAHTSSNASQLRRWWHSTHQLARFRRRTPRVSVIIAFWNAEPFLQEAIDSVFAQTFTDWELLFIDDGSTDASRLTAQRARARARDRVRVLAHPGGANRGVPASRNVGMRHARGELIAFLDADDVWLPEKLAVQVAALDRTPSAGFVYATAQWWHSWTGRPEDRGRDSVPDMQVEPNVAHPPPSLLPRFLGNAGLSPCPSSVVIRRDVAEQVGHCDERFRGSLALYEDQAFYAKVAVTVPMMRLDRCVARYRRHPRQMTWARSAEHSAARRFYLEWLGERLRTTGQGDHEVHRVLRNEYLELVPTTAYRVRRATVSLLRGVERVVRGIARRLLPRPARNWIRARLQL